MKIPLLLKIYLYIRRILNCRGFWCYFGWLGGCCLLMLSMVDDFIVNPVRFFCGMGMIVMGFLIYWIDKTIIKLEKLVEEDRKKFYEAIEEVNKRKN